MLVFGFPCWIQWPICCRGSHFLHLKEYCVLELVGDCRYWLRLGWCKTCRWKNCGEKRTLELKLYYNCHYVFTLWINSKGLFRKLTVMFRGFLEILASTYGPGPLGPYGPGPFIIWKNFLSQICSRTIFEIHTAPVVRLLYAPGSVCFSNKVLEHV